jgi:uncharacterized LabA/DUF88 family protein
MSAPEDPYGSAPGANRRPAVEGSALQLEVPDAALAYYRRLNHSPTETLRISEESVPDEKIQLHLFVDNSNVLIEGRRYAEMHRKGRSKLGAFKDDSYEIDWGKFLYVVKRKDTRVLAEVPFLYGSRPPPNDSVWERIRDDGFDVKVFDRNIRNKEKGVDMEMGMDIAERMHTVTPPRTMIIAAGDADYVPAVTRAQKYKWRVEIWFWSNAAAELKKAADEFCPLDSHFEFLRLGGGAVY